MLVHNKLHSMRQPAAWMQNPTDERILEVLATGLELGPATIGRNIDRHRTGVSRRLSKLVEAGLVEKVDDGYYAITTAGEQYLSGDLDASTIEIQNNQ